MVRKNLVVSVFVLAALLLSAVQPVLAQEATEPMLTAAPSQSGGELRPGVWLELDSSQPNWFKFEVGRLEGEESVAVSVQLQTTPFDGTGRFQLFEAGKAPFAWDMPEQEDWIGIGEPNEDTGLSMWSGDLVAGGYLVRVEPMGAATVRLGVSGQTVTY